MIIDYNNTLIYRLVCKDLTITDCYIGHTTNMIKRRQKHKADCKKINSYVYRFIRENGEWTNWEMIKIEDYPCKDRNDASKRERYWKEYYNATLNTNTPSRTIEEYRFDKYTEKLNREADERKRQDKLIREKYPRYLFYKCKNCCQYKEYILFNPILDDNGNYKFICDIKDANSNKVYAINDKKCIDCYNRTNEYIKPFKQHYKTILHDCKIDCACGLNYFTGFNTNATEIGQRYITAHMNSKKHKDWVALQAIKDKDKDILKCLQHLQKKQLIEICKVNNIYGMTNSKKANIITEILKYKDIKL